VLDSRKRLNSRPGCWAAAGLTLAVLAACGNHSAENSLESAKTSLEQRDFRTAIIAAKSALQANPDSGEARLLLGQALVAARDGESALLEFGKARALKVPDKLLVPSEAEAMLLVRQPAEMIARFGATNLGDPAADAALQTVVAMGLLAQQLPDKATVAIDRALALVPDHAPALLLRARMNADGGRFDEAGRLVDAVIKARPNDERAWVLRGELAMHGKPADLDAALKAYAEAARLRPTSTEAHAGIMFVHMNRGDMDAARTELAAMKRDVAGDPLTRFFAAQIALIDHQPKVARENIQPLLKAYAGDFKVQALAGAIELDLRSPATAENHLRQALQIIPGQPYATVLLAQAYLAGGQVDKALALLEPRVDAPDADAKTLSLAGEANLYGGNFDRAVALFTRAAALDPKDTKARTAVALSRMTKGDPGDALVRLATIAASSTDDFADLALISLHIKRKEFDPAMAAVDVLAKKRPDSAIVDHMRGRVHLAAGDAKAAEIDFERAVQKSPDFYASVVALVGMAVGRNDDAMAEKALRTYLRPETDNALARAWLIEIRARNGANKDELGQLVEDMVKRHPTVAAARLLLVNHLLAYGDTKGALTAAQEAVAAVPDSADLQDALGRAQLGNGDLNQAIASFRRLTVNYPSFALAHVRLADAYVMSGDADGAIRSLRRALELTPDLQTAQRGLINLLVSRKQSAEALRWTRTMQKQPANAQAGYLLEGDIESLARRWDPALAAYRAGLKATPGPELAVALHRTLGAAGRDAEADRFAQEWLAGHPKDNVFLFALGEYRARRSEWPAAEARFRQALELQPGYAAAANNLAFALVSQRKPEALAMAQKADQLAPDTPSILDTLALAHSAQGQHEKALEVIRRAVTRSGGAPSMRLEYARLLGASGDRGAARKELEALSLLDDRRVDKTAIRQLMAQMRD
jgi:putative PEP-CTERM system TPR-repeat lipoprotein